MSPAVQAPGRRERNKQQKLDRITTAARELFALHCVDEVTTQQIADRADVGTGTLFLYVATKAELLLLVHNVKYAEALTVGEAAAEEVADVLMAVMAVIRPIVECNRVQIENGRSYLKEIVFGDSTEPYHRAALALTARTEQAIAEILARDSRHEPANVAARARVVSAIMFLAMTASHTVEMTDDQVIADICAQVALVVAG